MEHTVVDHLLVLALAMVMPIYSLSSYQRFVTKLQKGLTTKIRQYQEIIRMEWSLFAAVILLWSITARPAREIGVHMAVEGWAWLGVGLAVAGCVVMIVQLVTASRDASQLESIRNEYQSLRSFMPASDTEYRWFVAVSITAGICEELLYRGFLMAYFTAYVGSLGALLISSIIFGLGHTYQGPKGVFKVAVVGLALGGVYLLTGSLWAPIVMHVVLDVVSGLLARRALHSAPVPA